MSTFAVIADLHVATGPRAEESRRVHRWIVETLRERRPDGILIAGDFFDHGTSPEERIEGAELLTDLANTAPLVGVPGNHDPKRELKLYNKLRAAYPISFYEQPSVHVLGDMAVALLPWRREAPALDLLRLPAAERRAEEEASIRQMLRKLGEQLDEAADGARTKLLIGHLMLREANVCVGQPERRGGEFMLGLDDLGLVKAHAYGLGHVHAGQSFEVNGSPVFYPGSTIRRTFGEIEEKAIALIHCNGSAVSVERVKTPATPMVLAQTSWREQDGRWGFAIDEAALLAEAAGADVRLAYEVPEAHREAARSAADEVIARLRGAGARTTKPEERVTVTARAKVPEIARASTLWMKVGLALVAKGCAETDPQHGRVLSLLDEIVAAG